MASTSRISLPDGLSYTAVIRKMVAAVRDIRSHTEAAQRLGVSEPTLRRWRSGSITEPRDKVREAVERFASEHGISLDGNADPSAFDSAAEEMLNSEAALMRTLTSRGGPGERKDFKLFLVRLLLEVAKDMKTEGKTVPTAHLKHAEKQILEGKL